MSEAEQGTNQQAQVPGTAEQENPGTDSVTTPVDTGVGTGTNETTATDAPSTPATQTSDTGGDSENTPSDPSETDTSTTEQQQGSSFGQQPEPSQDEVERDAIVLPEFESRLEAAKSQGAGPDEMQTISDEYTQARSDELSNRQQNAE